jgi:asparagine synthase (glutamine-hydrolysing)
MCGICGIYDFEEQRPIDKQVIEAMLRVIRHRGPDDDGRLIDKNLAIGMRRLSIIDLVSGDQPIYNEERSIAVVFNGEIYNYRELTPQLEKQGHKFTTASDTEVIVHLYEQYGPECIHWLRGMFAFALWDKKNRRLLIARDRLGIKPLYYVLAGNRLVFASEIKAILQHPGIQAKLDLESLSHFLSLKYVPSPQTLFKGIVSLPPGHLLSCDSNGVEIRRYWDLKFDIADNGAKSEEEYAEELEALIKESVKLRLRSDVPFGAFLSGGVDSSTIVALMSEFLNEPVKTFSVGFNSREKESDELPFARLIADKFQTSHHEVLIRPDDFIDLAHKVTWHLDQPIADQATIATYMLSKLAARHVKMVLSGEGGDELFAGYARYAGERFFPFVKHLPKTFKSLALSMSNRLSGLHRPKIALYALCQADESARFTNWFPLFNWDKKARLMSDDLKNSLLDPTSNDVFGEQLARTDARQTLNRMLYVDTKLWLPDHLLLRGDKLSMAASLEARVPLLDHKLVEFAAALPPHMKLNGLKRKYLLKKVSQPLLPAEIINRKKQGFPIPISAWFRKEARSFVKDTLSPSAIKSRGLFNGAYVDKLFKEHESGFADHGNLLWGIMSIEIWLRLFVDRKPEVTNTAMSKSATKTIEL